VPITGGTQPRGRPVDAVRPKPSSTAVTEAPLRLLYAGFDKLDIAFQGALGEDEIADLETAKSLAIGRQSSAAMQTPVPVAAVLLPYSPTPMHNYVVVGIA
jgi:hypothetical protein